MCGCGGFPGKYMGKMGRSVKTKRGDQESYPPLCVSALSELALIFTHPAPCG